MFRIFPAVLLLAALLPVQVTAQEWAKKMFNALSHDFGTVARGADAVYKFEVKNIYKEDVHLSNVRSTCGCTIASIEHPIIKTHETGYVVARFNTPMFTGFRSATLTVNVGFTLADGRHVASEVQLRCHGKIRSDIVFNPGSAKFMDVDQGTQNEKQVNVIYAGRGDWKIIDVKSTSDYYEVELAETHREWGRISYNLLIRLKENAPAGYLKDQLILVTNDQLNRRIPLDVEGRIIPEILVSPQSLSLGEIPKGERVTKTLVVRGKKPFKITGVDCDNGCLTFHADDESKPLHVVKVTFDSCQAPAGKVKQAIRINTDRGDNIGAVLTAYATIVQEKGQQPTGEEETTTSNDDTYGNQEASHSNDLEGTTTAKDRGTTKINAQWRSRNLVVH
ncbi:MAG: DUF1573 domain-containing protein [Pirellulales bacterium]|nr:DUF1573 domain-containing protein [Pirellulales bacterium]